MICLIGHPLGHSYSVPIHNAFGRYGYRLLDIPPESLDSFMTAFSKQQIFPNLPFCRDINERIDGINVTIPYKKAVLPYLSHLDESAVLAGCVNTVVFGEDGETTGYNTDLLGFQTMLTSAGIFPDATSRVLILGNGGTAGTAKAVMKKLGVIQIATRYRDNPGIFPDGGDETTANLLINATPVGMYPHGNECPIQLNHFPNVTVVADVIYNPLRTKLILDAQSRGLKTATGLSMLVCQAASACALFSKGSIPDFRPVLSDLEHSYENVVLIGMPGSGKSTVGSLLAQAMKREFVDTDAVIKEQTGRSPSQIILEEGEDVFRKIETDAIASLAQRTNLVIATGGGSVLNRENMINLKMNGRLFYLDRSLDCLPTDSRPLSHHLADVYSQRAPLYRQYADCRIQTKEGDPSYAANLIRKEFFSCHGQN